MAVYEILLADITNQEATPSTEYIDWGWKHYGKIRRSLDSFDALSLGRVTVFEIKIFGV